MIRRFVARIGASLKAVGLFYLIFGLGWTAGNIFQAVTLMTGKVAGLWALPSIGWLK